jgi:hypothetical protein
VVSNRVAGVTGAGVGNRRDPHRRALGNASQPTGCGGDPGSQFVDSGGAQLAVVVKSVQLFGDPAGWLGQDVVADGEPASLDGVVVRRTAVRRKDVADALLPASLSELES